MKKEHKKENPDEAVLDLLQLSSADQSKKRSVDFYLYFPTEETAKMADAKLTSLGFEVEIGKMEFKTDMKWLCLASKKIHPDLQTLMFIRKAMERIAEKWNGFYDGWETMLDADEAQGWPDID